MTISRFRAVSELNGVELEGKSLKVELAGEKRSRRGPRAGAPFGGLPGQTRQADFPLRILVQSDMVSGITVWVAVVWKLCLP